MKKEILINGSINDVRVAILENQRLVEYFIESPDNSKIVGNIYLGKVTNVIQGINAAFVNVGFKTDAFLHFSDVDESLENNFIVEDDDEEEESQENQPISNQTLLKKSNKSSSNSPTFSTKKSGEIKINLESGQEVIVQVTREAYSSKGVKVTSRISIAGKYFVLLPYTKIFGVSQKIQNYHERKRLRRIARSILQEPYGCIIRTSALGKTEEELQNDLEFVLNRWLSIEEKLKTSTAPTLLYQDLDLVSSIIRDLFTPDVNQVIIDSRKLYNDIVNYLKFVSPQLVEKVTLFSEQNHIFEYFEITKAIQNIYRERVNLYSGASIVIQQTEAMTVVDVNSGRAVEKDQEQTALSINMEALSEIAKQMRLRDIAGIILIDFIDMQQESNKKKLYNEMRKAMSRDRAKSVIFPLTQLGLMQITRQRIHQNIADKLYDECTNCNGTGRVYNKSLVLANIEKWIRVFKNNSNEQKVMLLVSHDLADYLTEGPNNKLSKLMVKYFLKIKLQRSENLHSNTFRFYSLRYQKDITQEFSNVS